ncbi:restriction endonuclease subunit S [Exiguobacterium sp. CinTr1]|uniref:restriction endonuclease subunit S n=1 Tax=Exiguobacterium sp. CinTr1 TaxID=2995315 RepID=UPI0022E22C11|nr:restriction endonuclease subunit S [Exiguobacterium sp. CinTr1]
MKTYIPYPDYEKTGLDWIPKLPKGWKIGGLTKFLDIIVDYRGKTPEKVEKGVFLVTAKNIKQGQINYDLSREYINVDDYEEVMRRGKPEIGDVLFTTEAPLGEVANVDREDIALAQRIIKFRALPGILDNYYLKYWILSHPFQSNLKTFATGSTAEGIKASKLSSLQVILPTISEQKKIVGFLDKKILEIDHLIRKKNNLINLLEQQRQSIITEAVTKGLNRNVKMKDSGVNWIGEIPEHWDVTKIIYYAKLLTGGTPDKNNIMYWEDGSINWMSSGEVNKEFIHTVDSKITELGLKNSAAKILPRKSIMMALNGQGKTKGKVAVLEVETTCNQSLAAFICNEEKLHYLYLYYYLKSNYKALRGLVGEGLRDGISLGLLKSIKMPLLPLKEQHEISKYLYEYDIKINDIISNQKSAIDLLIKYRQSLIYEVVTGKIDVRNMKID